ncbi:MAG: tetratricopeptide repeat protein [Asticcacaulis sp.]
MRWEITILMGLCVWLSGAAALANSPLYGADSIVDYQAFRSIEQKAESGDAKAQFELYNLYGLKKDYARAYEWSEKAADNGYAEALRWSFMRYDDGGNFSDYRTKIDYPKAFQRLKQLEVVDPEGAWFHLGIYYRYGKGVKRDYMLAFHYFSLRANPDKPEVSPDFWAQIELGNIYAKGLGIKRDDISAYVWYGLGSEQWLQYQDHPSDKCGTYIDSYCDDGRYEKISAHREKLRRRLTIAGLQTAQSRMKAFRDKYPLALGTVGSCEPSVVTIPPPIPINQ